MTAKDSLYDTTIELEFLVDEARAIIDCCDLGEQQKDAFESMVVSVEARCQAYQDAIQADAPNLDELHSKALIELDNLSEEIMQWSEVVKHGDLLRALGIQVEELEEMKSQAQDIFNQGNLPAMYYPGLDDMIDDIASRIEEYAALPAKTPIEAIQALGELTTAMMIFSDSLARYKQLADPDAPPEE